MNDHDSQKLAGVLLSRGYRQVDSIEAASFVLYNTCSIREKAAQKVFSRLGEFRDMPGEPKKSAFPAAWPNKKARKSFTPQPGATSVAAPAAIANLPDFSSSSEP